MRDIKFRAWEKNLREIIPIVSINFKNKMVNTENAWRLFNEIELMQYTGLKDKNGKDIYEGDIVNVNHYGGTPKYEKVHFYTTAGFVSIHPFTDSGYHWSANNCEVIGNIYENSEVLYE